MTSKAQRRRNRKKLAEFDLAPTPRRDRNGCYVERTRQQPADPHPEKTVLEARKRQFGGDDTKKSEKAVRGAHMGSEIGMVIERECSGQEVAALYEIMRDWSAAVSRYNARILGMSENAKGASIAMVPDRVQADESHTIDIRDPAEKDRQAVNAWMRWQGHLGHLSAMERGLLNIARRDTGGLWQDQRPTRKGLSALAALRALRKVVDA